jgi:hypothetical protein
MSACPRCGSPDQAWRRIVPGSNWGRVCNDDWHLVGGWQPRCRGCGELIEAGKQALVTVKRARHVITVYAHAQHREAARAAALEDRTWQRDQSHGSGA